MPATISRNETCLSPSPTGEIQRRKWCGSLDQDQDCGPGQIGSTDRGGLAASRPDLRAWRRGKQDAAVVDQALKAMRCYIQGRDIERVFISRLCPGALVLQNLVD